MREIIMVAGVVLFLACSNNQSKEAITSSTSGKDDTAAVNELQFAFPVNYSNVRIGDPKHSQAVLEIWKHSDANQFAQIKPFMAPSFEFHTMDGLYPSTSSDSLLSRAQADSNNFRQMYSTVSAIISYVATNKSTGEDENWVAIWGKRLFIDKKGKKDSTWLHEWWRANKDGKMDALYQFGSKIPPYKID